MYRFCEHSDFFGPVGEGNHSHWHGVAIFDVMLTIVGALLFTLFFRSCGSKWSGMRLYATFLSCLFALSIFLHHLFCVCTTVNSILFPNDPMCSNSTSIGIEYVTPPHTEL